MITHMVFQHGPPLQIVDLIQSLLKARTPQLLIVAGLIFLGVGVIGNIPGRLEPGERGRTFGLVFGVLLLATGLGLSVVGGGGGSTGGTPPSVSPTDTRVTVTPSPTPEAATVTPTLESVSFPQGFSEAGFTDPELAVSGHLRAVNRQSFTGIYTIRGEDIVWEVVIRANPDTRRVHKVWRDNGSVTSELYYDSGTVEVRTQGDRGFSRDAPSYATAAYLEGQLDWFHYSTLSNLQLHRQQGRTAIAYFVVSTREEQYHEGELTIAENGLVLEYNLRRDTSQGEFFVEYHTTALGETTVETPEWVDTE